MTLVIHNDLIQGAEPWHAARRGMVTASAVGQLITAEAPGPEHHPCPGCNADPQAPCTSKAKRGATISTYHPERIDLAKSYDHSSPPILKTLKGDGFRTLVGALVAERITGHTDPTYLSDDMLRGVLHEPYARERYAEVNGVEVTEVGFMVRDDWGFEIGASPDGLVGNDGGLEIKCPRAKTHIRTIAAGVVPAQYVAQIQTCLLVSGREWWDFVSFHAGLPMWTERVYPDPRWHEAIVEAVAAFEQAAIELTSQYRAQVAHLPATERIEDDLDMVI